MEKKFALKAAQALKKVKSLNAKNEFTNQLNFASLAICCEDGPILRPQEIVLSH